jgi:hypothetical protein
MQDMEPNHREEILRKRIDEHGHQCFPDDENVIWNVLEIRHHDQYSFVQTQPDPDTVGYPRFTFVFLFAAAKDPQLVGCYALDRGKWTVLFTSPGASTDWRNFPL